MTKPMLPGMMVPQDRAHLPSRVVTREAHQGRMDALDLLHWESPDVEDADADDRD